MKKWILSVLLCLCMVTTLMPVSVKAGLTATNITVTDATYYESGAVKSVTTKFGWAQDNGPRGRLVLMTEKLRSAGEEGTTTNYGDFSNSGYYAESFKTFDEVLAYDTAEGTKGTFGIVNYTDEIAVNYGVDTNTWSFSFANTDITLNKNQTYYVYFWTNYGEQYYPDNLFLVFQVENGALRYAVATEAADRNTYGTFSDVVSQLKYNVTINSAANMTKTSESGEAIQSELTTAMQPVVYTADDGYYFPEDYAVATVNGIMVKRDSETQITVYGTPSNNAEITLTAPTQEMKALEEITFGYAYDVQRRPAYPKKDDKIELYSLAKPLLADRLNRKDTNDGSWTLTKAGTYSYLKNTNKGTSNLAGIVDAVAFNYNLTGNAKEGIILHELKDGDTHIAYGVVIVYDAAQGYAGFIGDNIGGGAGYLLSKTALSSAVTADATMIVTDFVPTINYSISLDPNSTYTFAAATAGYDAQSAKTVTVTNDGNGATGDLIVSLGGTNADSFTLSKTTISSIAADDGNNTNNNTDTFTIVPNTGLSAGTYTATVNVSGNNIITASFDVTFTVNAAVHTCSLTPVTKENATCTTLGKEAYYHCDGCDKNYEDAEGTKEIPDITVWGNIGELDHTPSGWKYDKDNHWKECTVTSCGVKLDSAAHEFEWKIDKAASETENGSKHEECKVCGYKKDAVEIPATGTDTEDEEPENEETSQAVETSVVTQPTQTGDNNMAELWILWIFISTVGIAAMTTINRKRNSVK